MRPSLSRYLAFSAVFSFCALPAFAIDEMNYQHLLTDGYPTISFDGLQQTQGLRAGFSVGSLTVGETLTTNAEGHIVVDETSGQFRTTTTYYQKPRVTLINERGAYPDFDASIGRGQGELSSGDQVFLFGVDMCAVGFAYVINWSPELSGSSMPVSFEFIDRQGEIIDVENRWPARGATLQAYTVGENDKPIAALRIHVNSDEGFAIGDIVPKPCVDSIS